MKWSPPVDRLLGGLATIAMFAIGHRGPTGDDWTWEAPKGPAKSPLGGGPILPLAAAIAVGMMFGMAALASLDNDGGLSQVVVLQPTPTEQPDAEPTARPTPPVVRPPRTPVPGETTAPTPGPIPAPETEAPPVEEAVARVPASRPLPTPAPTPVPPPETGHVSPTPVPTPTPAPVAAEAGKLTGGGRAGGGQFSVEVLHTGDGAVHGAFKFHGSGLRIESDSIDAIAVASGPCGPATRAVVTGTGTVNGDDAVAFQVTADDCGEPGGPSPGGLDYLWIVASGSSAEGQVSGNLQVQLDS